MHFKLDQRACQFCGSVFLLKIIVEAEEVLRAVPTRLHGAQKKVYAHAVRVVAGQFALARAANTREDDKR